MIKVLRAKTEKELQDELTNIESILVKDLEGWGSKMFWFCSKCNIIFEFEDKIFIAGGKDKQKELCPLIKGRLRAKNCLNQLAYGEPEYFKKNYFFKAILNSSEV